MFKYNFVIAGGYGFYEVAYSDLYNLPNVAYFSSYIDKIESSIKRLVLRVNFNLKLNRIVKTPFAGLAYSWLFPHTFVDDKPLCFLFFGTQFAVINTSYIEYLRRCYPDAKLVLYMQDIVASLPYYDIENYKKRFDMVLSYDKGDSKRYGLHYYPTPYSRIDVSKLPVVNEKFDVFFCGAGKTRYKTIFKVYRQCIEEGLRCKFFITGVPVEERIEGEGLVYDTPISYMDNLAYVMNSKCILEVMQENADGYTPRLWESIMYDKHLLTNNKSIVDSKYYDGRFVHFIDEVQSIGKDIEVDINVFRFDEKRKMSPKELLAYIENYF